MRSANFGYIARLDHLRFLAAAIVILFHSFLFLRGQTSYADLLSIPFFNQGHTGVALFMVISGMILSLIAGDKKIIVSKFYLNRILRIYPLFCFVVTLGYFTTPDPRPTSVGIDYLMALLPISNLYRLQYGTFGGHLWTIAVELQFYLLFPFLLIFRRRYGNAYILGLIGFVVLLRAGVFFLFAGTVHQLSYFSIFGSIDLFLIGMLAGYFYMSIRSDNLFNQWWMLPACFVLVNIVIYGVFRHRSFFNVDYLGITTDSISRSAIWIFWPTVQALMWSSFVIAYLRSPLPIPFSSALATAGRYSYSMYVWHIFVLLGLQKYFLWMTPYTYGFFVALPATIALSAASYHLIEKPFLEMRTKYTVDKAAT
jgi:peptidoglycan/LPS O-acetylase OafA/YrhL